LHRDDDKFIDAAAEFKTFFCHWGRPMVLFSTVWIRNP